MTIIKLVYLANIIVAGWIGITSLFLPKLSAATVFSDSYPATEVIRLVGCLWLSIAILSALGLFWPLTFSPILLVQLIYKGCWLMCVALPAIRQHDPYPAGMAVFFIIWVLVLPFVIPWSEWVK